MQESVEAIERISSYIIVKQVSLKSAPYTPDQGTLCLCSLIHICIPRRGLIGTGV